MKKLFVVLAAILLLAIMACSGGGGDDGGSKTIVTSKSGTIDSSGGSIELPDGTKTEVTSDVLTDNTKVTISKIDGQQSSTDTSKPLSSTYKVQIPLANITTDGTSDTDLNNGITFKIPIDESIASKIVSKFKAATGEISDDAYTVSQVVIDNGTETKTLYGRYVVTDGVATVSVLKSSLLPDDSTSAKVIEQTKSVSSTIVSITAKIVNLKEYFKDVHEALYKVNNSSSSGFDEITSQQNTSGKIPVILIHGWQIFGDSNGKNPQRSTWTNFIDYFYSIANINDDLQDKFVLYSYRYDTNNKISDNAGNLETVITNYFPSSQKVIIIAHSMGGLVSHYYIQKHSGNSKVIKLITLATPYHGSPFVQACAGEINNNNLVGIAIVSDKDMALAMATPGSLDLRWDNFDNNNKISNPNTDLKNLNDSMSYGSLYKAFAGSVSNGLSYKVLSLLNYDNNDGVVPLVSAFNHGSSSGFSTTGPENDYDHSEMTGKSSSDPLLAKIKRELLALVPDATTYNISGQVTLNGSGLSGVAVALTGASSDSATTDPSGNYSFTGRADGNYTVTPSKTGYTFSPSSTAVTVSGADKPNINFTATASTVTYPMSGTIHSGSNSGPVLSGATVSIAGQTYTTSSTGTFTFTAIPAGTYAFSVSKSGYDTYTNSAYYVGADQSGLNFYLTQTTVTYSMGGTIHIGSVSGAVLSGATVSIAGLTATTDGTGYFYIAGIPAGTYAFSVSKSGYDTYTNSAYYVGSNQTALSFYLTPSSTSGDYTSAHIGTLKYVPAGSFQRDSTSTNISTVSAFRMSEYEITRAQFLAIMGVDPSNTTSTGSGDPVQSVTWYDAVEFCNKLSIAEGLTPVYTITERTPATGYPITDATVTPTWANNGYRLPTEMEWMWAAMGATSGYGYTSGTYTTGYLKAFAGSTGSIGDYAWTWENSQSIGIDMSQPVGTKLPNELGLYDMSGNVWEWCWDWYDTYPTGTQTNYRGAASGTNIRVSRGGSWNFYAICATVAYRNVFESSYRGYTLGFRVVRP